MCDFIAILSAWKRQKESGEKGERKKNVSKKEKSKEEAERERERRNPRHGGTQRSSVSKRTNCVHDEACARVTDTIRPEIEARKRKREDERAKIEQPRRQGEGETASYIGADQPRISKQCSREVERFASSSSRGEAQRIKRRIAGESEDSRRAR